MKLEVTSDGGDFVRIHIISMSKDDFRNDNHAVVEYELRLKNGTDFWVKEASDFFEQKSTVHNTLNELALSLKESGISYAVVGALALGQQGYLRTTIDIDILLTPDGLEKFRTEFVGKGYVAAFAGSKKSFRCHQPESELMCCSLANILVMESQKLLLFLILKMHLSKVMESAS